MPATRLIAFVFFLCCAGRVLAQLPFPQPPDTFFGNVFTDEGVRFDDDEIELVLFADGLEVGASVLTRDPIRNENFRILVPVQTSVPDNRIYTVMLREDGSLRPVSLVDNSQFAYSPQSAGLSRFDFADGTGGIVIRRPEQLAFRVVRELPDGWIEITFNDLPGWTLQIEGAPDLAGWKPQPMAFGKPRKNLVTSIVGAGSGMLTVAVPPRGFYRLVASR